MEIRAVVAFMHIFSKATLQDIFGDIFSGVSQKIQLALISKHGDWRIVKIFHFWVS